MEEMIPLIQAVSGVLSVFVAIVALWIAFSVERRNQRRFEEQIGQSRKVAQANIRPLLAIHTQNYVDQKGITLSNRGLGTAAITSIQFSKDDRTTTNLVEFFDLGSGFLWNTFVRFDDSKYYLSADGKMRLVELTKDHLVSQGWSSEDALQLLKQWQTKKSGISVRVEYEDLLGNAQEPLIHTLA